MGEWENKLVWGIESGKWLDYRDRECRKENQRCVDAKEGCRLIVSLALGIWKREALEALEAHNQESVVKSFGVLSREHILEEAAGILKDIYQEFDSREETTLTGEETELDPINDGLKCLSAYLVSLQCVLPSFALLSFSIYL